MDYEAFKISCLVLNIVKIWLFSILTNLGFVIDCQVPQRRAGANIRLASLMGSFCLMLFIEYFNWLFIKIWFLKL